MKPCKVWIARHSSGVVSAVRLDEPREFSTWLTYDYGQEDPQAEECKWIEHAAIPLEEE